MRQLQTDGPLWIAGFLIPGHQFVDDDFRRGKFGNSSRCCRAVADEKVIYIKQEQDVCADAEVGFVLR